MTVSSLLNMEFVQALNPLYAFPIVAVILCVFVVYAFGFKAPVQPPSFEGFAEEKKISKKRKTKDLSKGKAVQNGNITLKAQIPSSNKKRESEKPISADKIVEKSSEKKASKSTKPVNEKRVNQEKKKESFSHEDAGDDGWVQLVSKKGRKGRKKEETNSVENQDVLPKVTKSTISNVFMPDKEPLKEENSNVEKSAPIDKPPLNEDKKNISEAPVIEVKEDMIKKDAKVDISYAEKENEKLPKESSNKSKKKKKKNTDVVNMEEILVSPTESPPVEIISELITQNETKNSSDDKETLEVITGSAEEIQLKTPKSSNVVFDELAGLCPEPKELKKKKKVRRDH